MTRHKLLLILTGFFIVFSDFIPLNNGQNQTPLRRQPINQNQVIENILGPEEALARRRGGGFGRIRSSRSLWNRKTVKRAPTRRSTPKTTTRRPQSTANKATTPRRSARSTNAAGRNGRPVANRSAMSTRISKEASQRSLNTHKTKQNQFAKPSTTAHKTSEYKNNPIYNRGSQNRVPYDRYYDRRDQYYGGFGWRTPGYAFMSYPSFGMWDALIWWSILDNLGSRHHYSMAHHHRSDAGYQEWRSEAKRLSADNAELKQKLDQLDQKVATLEGTPVDPNYLPPGVDPSVALAAEVVATANPGKPQLILGTGVQNGNYHRFGTILQAKLPEFEIMLQPSNGSEDNLKSLIENKADAILVQSDVFNHYLEDNPDAKESLVGLQSTLYTEFLQLLVNEGSGITAISDLDPKTHVIYVGPRGSGTHGAWRGFRVQDPRYSEFNTRHASYEEALKQVSNNAEAVMIFVGGLNSELLKSANTQYSDKVNLVAVDEHHFSQAKDQFDNIIYTVATIPHETYPNIQDGWLLGFLDSSIETLKVEAVLILSQQWVDTYGSQPMTFFEDAVWRSIDEIEPIVGED